MSERGAPSSEVPLFVYGTLRSGETAAHLLAPDSVRRARAVVRGRLVDTGQCYPGAVFERMDGAIESQDGSAGGSGDAIEGELIWLRPERYAATLARLDAYEDAPRLFRRVLVVAQSGGERFEAFAYEWQGAST